jgi:tRNA A58 N-methylase Trm61
MAGIGRVGGGYQTTDGNLNEIEIGAMAAPQTATATATLTVAQVTGGMLVANPSTTAATYTFPTATALDAALANVKIGSTFDLSIINLGTGSGALTLTMGAGTTLVGSGTVAVSTSAVLRFRRTGVNDIATFVAYRLF